MIWIGMLIGGLIGAILGSLPSIAIGIVAGGALGALIVRSENARRGAAARSSHDRPSPEPAYGRRFVRSAGPAGDTQVMPSLGAGVQGGAPVQPAGSFAGDADAADVASRLARIERRLGVIEQRLGIVPDLASPRLFAESQGSLAIPLADGQGTWREPRAFIPRQPDGTALVEVAEPDAKAQPAVDAPAPDASGETATAGREHDMPGAQEPRQQPRPAPAYVATRGPNPLWAWLTGGNTLTRIGAVVLFFGVAFLLRYFAERFTVPLEWRLLGVGAFGFALAALGALLARRRAAYGLSLIGAGAGIVYLTVFAAFRAYAVLPPAIAFALLVVVATATTLLASRNNSQPLAWLALAGGFLAPVLIGQEQGEPAPLFGYFALLNAAILALALAKVWRALNVLGFVFTFGLGLAWGWQYYRPEHFAVVQPFLALFFVFYVGIAILYAFKAPLLLKAPVDGLLVFGVPLVGFALQTGIVRAFHYGVAWSAIALGAIYAVLWLVLRRRLEAGLQLLASVFLALAVIFGTLAIPYATDPHWTTAWWSLEAAAVYWIGCRQEQRLARGFALLLQLAASLAFVWGGLDASAERLFINPIFFGTSVIALAAFVTAFVADRHADRLGNGERALVPLILAWGAAWWLGGSALDLHRHLNLHDQPNAILAWVTGSAGLALALCRVMHWPRIGWLAAATFPTMVATGIASLGLDRTTLDQTGLIVWPLAWLMHAVALWDAEALVDRSPYNGASAGDLRETSPLREIHATTAVAWVAWLSWEAGEWVGRWTIEGTVWIACATGLPSILFLAAVTRWELLPRWPMLGYGSAYLRSAGTVVATLLGVWFVMVNLVSPGDPAPLPYLPLANPLDVTVALALVVLFRWASRAAFRDQHLLYACFAMAVFVAVNCLVVRTAHHWAGVPWEWSRLLAYKPLQAALTLTWTATALPLMLLATRRAIRPLWMAGAGLLALVVGKLFIVDLAALSGLPRVVAFIGVGLLLLVIGYFAPLPPPRERDTATTTQ